MQISIVIPVYNALALTKQCVQSIYDHGSDVTFEIVLVDNGSDADVEQWAASQLIEHTNLRYLRYPEPLGFARSVNAGAAAANGEVLILLNSDTVVTAKWMDELYAELLKDPSLGALSPITNHAGEPAQMDFGVVDMTVEKALAAFARRPRKPEILYLPQRITFFCAALRRDTWLSFNGLDEAYAVGNFEDDDLCLRLRVLGYRLGVATHVFVYHHNNATFTANKISHGGWMAKNAATFAARGQAFAEADPLVAAGALRWPRKAGHDISVVVLPCAGGSLDRTLRSLRNQTISGFEVIPPGSGYAHTRTWIAYLHEGDIFYPFHLEALHEALTRGSVESIYADCWAHRCVNGESSFVSHPDSSRHIRKAPLMLAGWMHHSSLDPALLYEESVPHHWARITWEAWQLPEIASDPQIDEPGLWNLIEMARFVYRKAVPLEKRYAIDRIVRRVIRSPLAEPEASRAPTLSEHLEELISTRADAGRWAIQSVLPSVLMFNAVSWNSVTQRQHHFARGLAEHGHIVFWVEPSLSPRRNWWTSRALQQVAPGIFLLRLPAIARDIYTLNWDEDTVDDMVAAALHTFSVYGVREAVTLINYPRFQPVVKRLRERCQQKVITDCLDDQRAFADIYQTVLLSYEEWLEENSDLFITSSMVLQNKMGPHSSTLLHNACNYDLFSEAKPMGYLTHVSRPVIGFFGVLADWLDTELIQAAALRFPDWTFVYIGPHTFSHSVVEVEWIAATNLPNIVVLPQQDLRTLAAHLSEFDVCTIPFRDIAATRAMNPVKLYEYLAAGKPVVARDLPEVRYLVDNDAKGLVSLYSTPKEFFQCLQAAVAEDDGLLRTRRQSFARANDWSERADKLSALLVDLVQHSKE